MTDDEQEDVRARALRRAGAALPAPLVTPDPSRFDPSEPANVEACRVHAHAVFDDQDGYVDPDTHYFVFTAAYHWQKGTCCELGCRHCPWVNADARLSQAAGVSGRTPQAPAS